MDRDFKGIWIDKEIWLDKRLNALDKIILAEIDSLDIEEKGCWASNDYLAEFCQCNSITISRTIKKLKELGFIEQVSFDGRHRILKSRLSKMLRQPKQNDKAALTKSVAININNNIKNNKNYINKNVPEWFDKEFTLEDPDEETQEEINQVIQELNKVLT